MPTASIDFAFAAFTTIMVVMGAICGINMLVEPYMDGGSHSNERFYQIGSWMLLSAGDPVNWGAGNPPTNLGFASAGDKFELDIDKVTLINPSNEYCVNYSVLWQALGMDDLSFNIRVEPLFDLSLTLDSSKIQGSNTVYNFTAITKGDGYPLPAQISYYVTVRDSLYSESGTTDDRGIGTINFTLPNSQNGTALLVGIAQTVESIRSYSVLPFSHLSGTPASQGDYATLSPLNYILNANLSQDATILKAYFLSFNSYSNEVGWLNGWEKRVRFTVDHGDFDENVTDFPVLLYLSSSSGLGDDDLSFVFDELQNNSNRGKIAVTASDGVSQRYVEIERWDDAGEKAWLWVRIPEVSNVVDTVLYLYFDAVHSDNTDYVGDPGSVAAQMVWDNDYIGVWHLSDNPGGSAPQIRDSKAAHHGTSYGSMGSGDQQSGQMDGSIHFDGSNDYIDFGNSSDLDITEDITLELWLNADSFAGEPDLITKGDYTVSYSLWLISGGEVRFGMDNDRLTSLSSLSTGFWNYIAAKRSGSYRAILFNGTEDANDIYGTTISTTADPLMMSTTDWPLQGLIDEVRISKAGRSDAWIRASYETGIDNMIDYGSEESRAEYGSISYSIPHTLDVNPWVLVLTGVNSTDYWAEWVVYPQIPLEAGANMSDEYLVSDVFRASYVVEVEKVLYRFSIDFRSPREDD